MEEERILKVRLYTDIKPNYVLVGQNTFTKNLVIFEKQMFHMPWYKTRFVKMTQRNLDIPPVTVETDNGTLPVNSSVNFNL